MIGLYFILISALINEYNIKGELYNICEIITHIFVNIASYFILEDKYVILYAVEELITKKNMEVYNCEIKEKNKILKYK